MKVLPIFENFAGLPSLIDSVLNYFEMKLVAGKLRKNQTKSKTKKKALDVKGHLIRNLRTGILTEREQRIFRNYAQDKEDHTVDRNIFKSLEVCPSKFGRGLRCRAPIEAGSLVGVFYGELYRRLPVARAYSFDISVERGQKLYLGAENPNKRPILA